MIPLRINLAGYLAIALALCTLGWALDHWSLTASLATLERAQAAQREALATQRADIQKRMRTIEGGHAAAVAALTNQLHQTEAQNAKLELARDIAIAAGAQRVYVRASCPDREGGTADPATTSGSDGASAELDPAYRSTLSDLRRGAATCHARLTSLQAWATETMATLARAAGP